MLYLQAIHAKNEQLGFWIRALMDKGAFNWFDASNNTTFPMEGNIFDCILNSPEERAKMVCVMSCIVLILLHSPYNGIKAFSRAVRNDYWHLL